MSKSSFKFCLFISTIINLFCFLLIFSSIGHCASEQSYFPCSQNENDTIPSYVIDYVSNNYNLNTQNVLIYGPYQVWSNGKAWYVLSYDKDSSGFIYGFDHTRFDYIFRVAISGTLNNFKNTCYTFYDTGSFLSENYLFWNTSDLQVVDFYSSVYSQAVSYWSNFSVNSIDDLYTYVIYDSSVLVPEGSDPTPFDDTGLNLDSSLNATTVPSVPSAPSLQFDPLPTWDSQAPFESLGDIIKWGVSVLGVLLNAIITVVSNWIQFIGNLLSYLVQKLLDFIKAVINWLYSQFLNWLNPYLKTITFIGKILFNEEGQVSIFDLMAEFFVLVGRWLGDFWDNFISNSFISDFWSDFTDNLSDVLTFFRNVISLGFSNNEFSLITLLSNVFRILFIPDSDDLSDLLVSHDIYGVLGFAELVQTNINYIKSLITVNTRSVSYKFTVPEVTIMGVQCGSFDIDFSWYLDYKNVGDPIISAFLIFGWFLWIHGRLPYWLRGQQGDVVGFAREVQK